MSLPRVDHGFGAAPLPLRLRVLGLPGPDRDRRRTAELVEVPATRPCLRHRLGLRLRRRIPSRASRDSLEGRHRAGAGFSCTQLLSGSPFLRLRQKSRISVTSLSRTTLSSTRRSRWTNCRISCASCAQGAVSSSSCRSTIGKPRGGPSRTTPTTIAIPGRRFASETFSRMPDSKFFRRGSSHTHGDLIPLVIALLPTFLFKSVAWY
jgi:hypothetical protein